MTDRPPATTNVPCDLCGRDDYEPIASLDRDGRPLRTVLCRACGLVWTTPRPSHAAMADYYATTYRLDYSHSRVPTPRKILRGLRGADERRRALRLLLRDGASALDVGCGAGEFVYLLRLAGIDAQGIEPSGEFAGFSQRVLGVPIQIATVHEARVEPDSLDVVTMFHVLEHMFAPRQTLALVRRWLRRGGVAVVEVPNVLATVQAPRHRFHFAHLYNFSPATLAAMGEVAGLRVEGSYLSPDGGNVTCVFRRVNDECRSIDALPASADDVRRVLRSHTATRHYLSAVPYRRAAARLARRWREDRDLRRLRTMDAILAWARETLTS